MKRSLLFLTAFLATTLGGMNSVWADDTPSGFWDNSDYWATILTSVNPTTKTLTITSEAELALFAFNGAAISADAWRTGYEGWIINLGQEVNMSAHYWKPISFQVPFRGTFNGNGHTISGLNLDANQINDDDKSDPARMTRNGFGLFAEIEGTVENLNIANSSFFLKKTKVSTAGHYLGAFAGKLINGGCLRNCTVASTTVEGINYIGGLVGALGSNYGEQNLTTIEGCTSAATVKGDNYVGGIAGQVVKNASLRYCLYTGSSTVTASVGNGGLLVGYNSSTVEGEYAVAKNYFTSSSLSPMNALDRKGYKVALDAGTTGLALDFGNAINYRQSGITAYEHILKYGDDYLAGEGDEVTFGLTITAVGKTYINNVRVNGNIADRKSDKYVFTMPAAEAVVTAALLDDNSWDQEVFRATEFSVVDHTNKVITIIKPSELGLLAYNVNSGIEDYEGWTIEIGKDGEHTSEREEIDPGDFLTMSAHGWVPIGTRTHPFKGTFDGKGSGIRSLMIADTKIASDYSGLFGYLTDATIKSLKLEGCIIQGMNYVGAIAGSLDGTTTVTDCVVEESSVIAGTGDYVGGIAGLAQYQTTVKGNVCAAPVAGVKAVGGLIGLVNSTATIEDNMYTGVNGYVNASGTKGNGWVSYIIGNINNLNPNIHKRNYSIASKIETTINNYDYPAYTITSGNSAITLSFDGEQIDNYATSGIKSYPNRLELNGEIYAIKDAELQVTLKAGDNAKFQNVTASSGTLTAVESENPNNSKHTLLLNSGNEQTDVIISATIGGTFWTTYAAESFNYQYDQTQTIKITTPEELALLAKNVNSGTTYEGWTITLDTGISLEHVTNNEAIKPDWMPIGNSAHPFKGTFNGAGKTISNLKISADNALNYAALFGCVLGTSNSNNIYSPDVVNVKGVKLANSSITGNSFVGGIVAMADRHAWIENCAVESTTICGEYSVGGIVGQTKTYSLVSGCLSAAEVTGKENSRQNNIGGIVGESNGTVEFCVYSGSTVTGRSNVAACIGRIVSWNYSNVYYTNPALNGKNSFDTPAYSISNGTENMTVEVYTETASTPVTKEFTTSGLKFYSYSKDTNNDNVYDGGFMAGDKLYGANNDKIYLKVTVTPKNQMYSINANSDPNLLKYHDLDYGLNMTDADGTGWFTLQVQKTSYELTVSDASSAFEGGGEVDFPYLIHNTKELYRLAVVVAAGGDTYQGKHFRLENDLEYTGTNNYILPIGTDANHSFQGYFDGNGKTISGINFTSTATSGNEYLGVFGYIRDGWVRYLRLANTTFVGSTADGVNSYVGGIVAYCEGVYLKITNIVDCAVDNSVTLSGKYVGGIAAWVGDQEANPIKAAVEGCVSAARISATYCAGGIIGWMRGNDLEVKNCLYTGNSVAKTGTEGYQAYCVGNYNSSVRSLDIYYTDQSLTNQNANDKIAYTVTTDTPNLVINHLNSTHSYSLTGIQSYSEGMTYGGTFYAAKGQQANFTLSAENSGTITDVAIKTPSGHDVAFTVNDGEYSVSISNSTPSNVIVSATITIEWAGSGTSSDPYQIDNTNKLNLLAERVNSGNAFTGIYFKQTADIDYSSEAVTEGSNFTPIGNLNRHFKGIYDGDGHSVKGIQVTSSDSYVGFFGCLSTDTYSEKSGVVKNLTLEDISITGTGSAETACAGTLVGFMTGDIALKPSTIENCHVVGEGSTVTGNIFAGGLIGTVWRGNISGCTTTANVGSSTTATSGGLIGNLRSSAVIDIKDCLYLGSTVTGTTTAYGIASKAYTSSFKSENVYYHATLTSGAGSEDVKAYETTQGSFTFDGTTTQYTTFETDASRAKAHNGITSYQGEDLLKYGDKFYSRYQKGDANGDGVVNVTDYVGVIDYIHGRTTGLKPFTTDANGDGVVNVTDAVRVIDIIHGK